MKLYSTLTGAIQPLSPHGDAVTMYVCGITPYSPSHVGHGMRSVIFDVLRRYLVYRGYKVRHVENFTDIDDKLINSAAKLGCTYLELAEKHIQDYLKNIDALNVQRAHVYPRATQEIPKIIEIIDGLIKKGYAYRSEGDVYFRVRRDDDYGKLSHRSLDDMKAGARVEVGERKEDPMDFALWKGQKPGEPAWGSPWGPGRPGWHIECSAMSLKYLGETMDIHGGGQDLIFPHHENEIAQTESFTGVVPMARFWVHNGLLQLGNDKMSKSLGNFITLSDLVKLGSPDAIRVFFLQSHYRSPLSFSADGIAAQERALERLRAALAPGTGTGDTLDPAQYRERFDTAMDDDLNTPRAVAVLFDISRDINRARTEGRNVAPAQAALREIAGVLGLTLQERKSSAADTDVAPLMELLIETRAGLRKAKQYQLADQVRNRLAELGYTLEDTPSGTEWKKA
ncbi:MAG: cysteine--tRNA ligase [SAR202 cluster bacterium]|nr:cysteine--tRNA ligase [SAR202 cluster bacterium]